MQALVCADPTCQTPPGEVGVSDPRIRDVRLWHLADSLSGLAARPLLGAK
jgi:hypothetical protein